MIDAANSSVIAFAKLELGLPFWRLYKTPTLKKLYDAHDFFTLYNHIIVQYVFHANNRLYYPSELPSSTSTGL